MPCMCVPVLEMDGGMKMPETMAIARYLAREYSKYYTIKLELSYELVNFSILYKPKQLFLLSVFPKL